MLKFVDKIMKWWKPTPTTNMRSEYYTKTKQKARK